MPKTKTDLQKSIMLTAVIITVLLSFESVAKKGVCMTKSAIAVGEKAAAVSYGACIQKASIIVRGEYKTDGTVRVKEVLQGGADLTGKTLRLSQQLTMGCRAQPVPNISDVILMLDRSKNAEYHPVEIYDTPDQFAFLRILIPIYKMSSEQSRLKALTELFLAPPAGVSFESDPKATFKKEFLWAISEMREPANFNIVKQLYLNDHISNADKLSLQQWIGLTRDARAASILTEALKSKDLALVNDAASQLLYYYSGGKTEQVLVHALPGLPSKTREFVAANLAERGVKTPDVVRFRPVKTPYQKAEELNKRGKRKEAIAAYLAILDSQESNEYIIRDCALKALEPGDAATRARILKSRVQWFNRDAAKGDYLQTTDTATILKSLHDPKCLDGLQAILPRREFVFAKANRIATMAIRELGLDARKKASEALLGELYSAKQLNAEQQLCFLLETAWIARPQDLKALTDYLHDKPEWTSSWSRMEPIINGLSGKDEGRFLVALLKDERGRFSPAVSDWIVFRLGELRDARAVNVLFDLFQEPYSSQVATVSDALQSIGGDELVKRLQALALNPRSPSQGNAIELLAKIEEEKALPIITRAINNGSLDTKVKALNAIGRFGNCSDRDLLAQTFNYWTNDRALHYWHLQAISSIEQRCQCKSAEQK